MAIVISGLCRLSSLPGALPDRTRDRHLRSLWEMRQGCFSSASFNGCFLSVSSILKYLWARIVLEP